MAKKIIIGSRAFFEGMKDFNSKDIDEMQIQDKWLPRNRRVFNFKKNGHDVFFWSPLTKEEYIEDAFKCGVRMRVGKFIVPEFAEYIGLTIDDLKRLKPIFNEPTKTHSYQNIIFDSYIENGGFFLTDEQRLRAYEEYKRERPDRYV